MRNFCEARLQGLDETLLSVVRLDVRLLRQEIDIGTSDQELHCQCTEFDLRKHTVQISSL